jgi:hypothetical protein
VNPIENNWIVQNLQNALDTWNRILAEILAIILQSPKDFRGGGIWNVITTINGGLQAVGLALLVLFFAMSVFKTASNVSELKRPEAAVKMFIRFAVAKAAISHGMELLMTIFSVCQSMLATVGRSLGGFTNMTAALPTEVATAIAEAGFMESIPLWIVTMLGGIFILVLSFLMLLTIYGRFFRLYIMTAIAPIPLSTFAGEATSHYGKSFLKSYVGVCMEGVIVMLACVIFSAYASSPPDMPPAVADASAVMLVWDYVVELIFNLLVLLGTIKISERVTKELLGL